MSGRRNVIGGVAETSMWSAGVLLVVALFLMVNYLGWKYHQRLDWTSSEIYTLSDKSLGVVGQLDQDVLVTVFMQANDQLYPAVKELLARYEAASPRVTVREVDPSRNLAEAQQLVDQYQIEALNVILFESEGEQRIVETEDLAEYDYSGMQFGEAPKMTGFKGEQSFTSALLELSESERPSVLFTTGHGELQLVDLAPGGLSGVQDLLERDNFAVRDWASLGATAVPPGTELVVIAGPTANFVQPELDALAAFLDGGGRLLVLLDPVVSTAGGLLETGLEPFLSRYGVVVGNDIVVDPANPLPFFGAETIFANNYGNHPITTSLAQAELPTILPLARSVGLADGIEGFVAEELVRTTDEGWGETDLSNLGAIQFDEQDLAGPVSLGVALSGPGGGGDEATTEGGSRLVVLGDAGFATNAQLRNVGNVTLLSNALNWLVEREALVAIAAKTPENVRLSLSSGQMKRVLWGVVAGLPALVVAFGVLVSRRRRWS